MCLQTVPAIFVALSLSIHERGDSVGAHRDDEEDHVTAEQRFATAAEAMRTVDAKDLKAVTALRRQRRAAHKVLQILDHIFGISSSITST
jgi:hypothetical protein